MNSTKIPETSVIETAPVFPYFMIGLLLAVSGWGGMLTIVVRVPPDLFFRWLFFFLLMIALAGTVLPGIAYLHRRFPSVPPTDAMVITREAIFFGIYGNILAWMQLGKMLNPVMALLLAAGFSLLEVFLRLGERARWKPKEPDDE